MNLAQLNPKNWLPQRPARKGLQGQLLTSRQAASMGPWTNHMEWLARDVSPRLYEAMREACPVLDGAVARLVTLDGIVRVEGENDKLVAEIEDFIANVPVNDMQVGLQSFFNLMANERYEQGFCIGETQLEKDGRDVARLWVGDSKGFYFRRPAPDKALETWYAPPAPERNTRLDGTMQVERVLRNTWNTGGLIDTLRANGYHIVDTENMVYASLNAEADNPYGVSLFRSMEFVVQTLLVITTATRQTWARFGDPVFNVLLKSKGKTEAEILESRRTALATNLSNVLSIKKQGNSADLVTAIGRDDELTIEVLGGNGQVLEIEHPIRSVLEQVMAKTGLPPWMLGYIWGTAERLADRQVDLVLQESKTRFALWKPALTDVVATMLRARGRTWKRGDWELVQELPNLKDEESQARARFMNTQADAVERGDTALPAAPGGDNGKRGLELDLGGGVKLPLKVAHQHKVESYVEDEAQLMRLERTATAHLLAQWHELREATLEAIGVAGKSVKQDPPLFLFDVSLIVTILRSLETDFIASAADEERDYARSVYQAWLRGLENASAELGPDAVDAVVESVRAQTSRQLAQRGLELVTNATLRTYREDIIATLEEGIYNGLNPRDVARELRKRFDVHDYEWERLARSEIAAAQARGKMDEYSAMDLAEYDWIPAGDACPICTGIAAAGPYAVGRGPLPVSDSHPHCRCTVVAVV